MITLRTFADVPADRQIVVSLPPETPTGRAELVVTVTPQETRESLRGNLRRRFGTIHSGDSRSADNERIDADLARAYEGTHE
jgi:hypothetical protein